MNDEIKEILEQLEWYKKIGEKDIMFPEHLLTNKKVFLLLDYITNLQQEKDTYKEQLRITHKDLEHYISRCEKAYEELTYMSSSDYVKDYDIKQNCWIKLSNILQNGSDNNEKKQF